MCMIIQLEPTVKGTVKSGVMDEVHSQWLESTLYHPCVLIYSLSPERESERGHVRILRALRTAIVNCLVSINAVFPKLI